MTLLPDEEHWRRKEGDRSRVVKGNEAAEDPDWSLAEISRDKGKLIDQFFDWWQRNRTHDAQKVDDALRAWTDIKYETPLCRTGFGMLLSEAQASMREHRRRFNVDRAELVARNEGEDVIAYLERHARTNGWWRGGHGARTMPEMYPHDRAALDDVKARQFKEPDDDLSDLEAEFGGGDDDAGDGSAHGDGAVAAPTGSATHGDGDGEDGRRDEGSDGGDAKIDKRARRDKPDWIDGL